MWAGEAASGWRQRVALAIATGMTTALIAVVIFSSRGLLHLRTLTGEQDELGHRIALLLHENEQLRDRIQRLRNDDRTLERLAREQLGFTRPGEVIYRFGARPNPAVSLRVSAGSRLAAGATPPSLWSGPGARSSPGAARSSASSLACSVKPLRTPRSST